MKHAKFAHCEQQAEYFLQQVIAGLGDIIMTATTSLAQAQGSSKYTSGFDSDAVFDAYREVSFLSTHRSYKH